MVRAAAFIGAAIGVISISAAQGEPVQPRATDFSSQQQQQKKKVVPVVRGTPVQPRSATGNRNLNVNRNTTINRNNNVNVNRNTNINRNSNVNVNRNNNINVNRNNNINRNSNVNINTNRRIGGTGGSQQFQRNGGSQQFQRNGVGQAQRFGGAPRPGAKFNFVHGPGRVMPYRAVNHPMVKIGSRFAPVVKSQKKLYWGGKWKTFVPLAALGAVAIGGAYYYADGYLATPRPACQGITPDGCRLNWQRVDFEGGDSEWQCVQYCRRPGAPPPARTVALVSPPPMTQGSCEVSIFSEPGFRGTDATSTDEQPHLSELGWRDQIASIRVVSGTWDFFNGEDFTGEAVRFAPGEYADLGPDWSRKAGSFMCVQP